MIWSRFVQVSCLPNKCQCELARDALIRQPSAFWSSLAYILAGLAIYRNIQHKTFELKIWALACVLLGLSSLFGHASYIQVAMAFDFASIILILSFFAILNLLRMMKWSMWYFVLYYAVLVVAMYSMGKFAKIGMCLLVFAFAMGDVIRDEGWNFLKEKTLQLSLGILVLSFGLFLLDENHIGCDPTSLFQFHSLWHIGTALSMYFYGKWRLGSE